MCCVVTPTSKHPASAHGACCGKVIGLVKGGAQKGIESAKLLKIWPPQEIARLTAAVAPFLPVKSSVYLKPSVAISFRFVSPNC